MIVFYNEFGYEGFEVYILGNGINVFWVGNVSVDVKFKYQGVSIDLVIVLIEVIMYFNNNGLFFIFNFNDGFGYYQGDLNLDGKVKYQGVGNDLILLFINFIFYLFNIGLFYNYDLFFE